MKKMLYAASLMLVCVSWAYAQVTPRGSVSASTVSLGGSLTFTRDGDTPNGFAWSEATLWKPDGGYDVLGQLFENPTTQTITPNQTGGYSIQFRLVDSTYAFSDQWITFTVTAAAPSPNGYVTATTISSGGSTTFARQGATPNGFGWSEATLWKPNGTYSLLGTVYQNPYSQLATADAGPGNYAIQFRLVDAQQNFTDQVIWFTATASLYTTPAYEPGYWNDWSTIQFQNNCYNYANNKRTDHYAQPGYASGQMVSFPDDMTAEACSAAAIRDGLEPTTAEAVSPEGKTKIALVIDPYFDYHWYRQDSNGMWSHKRGQTQAKNVDESGNPIYNPETADRATYTVFAGYFFTPSDAVQGAGHANIDGPYFR